MRSSLIFHANAPLYLASASPRRIAFFRELGLAVTIMTPPETAEPSPLPGEKPASYVVRAAAAKALGIVPAVEALTRDVRNKRAHPSRPPVVIAADTVVVLDDAILGKPKDADHAFAMLSSLAGRTHSVTTGCVLLRAHPEAVFEPGSFSLPDPPGPADAPPTPLSSSCCFAVQSRVRMWDCPPPLIRAYASSGEPLDKAGAYAVQGAGAFLVESLEGSWSNVVGLPLAELVRALLAMDVLEAGERLPLPNASSRFAFS